MDTNLIDIQNPDNYKDALNRALELISHSEVIGIPTETVYGLAANAFDQAAVEKIYLLKNRPADNPLILHVGTVEQLMELIDPKYYDLALKINQAFWPGPITIVVPKSKKVPDWLTRGLDTVAVRIPDSKIMRDISVNINAPLAAPSANLSGRPSPTRANHVVQDFDKKIQLVIDNGPTDFGLESTVIDITDMQKIVLLRPGAITRQEIALKLNLEVKLMNKVESKVKSPGLKYKHYAPSCEVQLLVFSNLQELSSLIVATNLSKECLMVKPKSVEFDFENFVDYNDISDLSKNIFNIFRMHENSFKKIVVAYPAQEKEAAVYNRLQKAAGI